MAGKAIDQHHKEMGAFNQVSFPAGMQEVSKRIDSSKPLSAPMAPRQKEPMAVMIDEMKTIKKKTR